MHGCQDVVLQGLALGVLLVVRQDNHVVPLVLKPFVQEPRHVLDIIDAPSQLALLPKVIDADEQRLPLPRAIAVRERIVAARNTEAGLAGGRWRRGARDAADVGVLISGH